MSTTTPGAAAPKTLPDIVDALRAGEPSATTDWLALFETNLGYHANFHYRWLQKFRKNYQQDEFKNDLFDYEMEEIRSVGILRLLEVASDVANGKNVNKSFVAEQIRWAMHNYVQFECNGRPYVGGKESPKGVMINTTWHGEIDEHHSADDCPARLVWIWEQFEKACESDEEREVVRLLREANTVDEDEVKLTEDQRGVFRRMGNRLYEQLVGDEAFEEAYYVPHSELNKFKPERPKRVKTPQPKQDWPESANPSAAKGGSRGRQRAATAAVKGR